MPRSRAVALALGLLLLAVLTVACGKADRASREPPPAAAVASPAAGAGPAPARDASASAASPDGARRIIHTAEISVETSTPDAVAAKVAALADARGGFVVSSDTAHTMDSDGGEMVSTTIVFRVLVAAFDDAVVAVRALGTRVASEKITGQDVTEEYVDLEARIRAQQALETQYMAVLKEARTIPDILAVQQKLGEVRTEIERAEGRRRLLESQTSLSTITVHVARRAAPVEASGTGFGRSVRQAGRDSVDVAVAIVNGAIRLVGVLLPVLVLLVAPLVLLTRLWLRRRRRYGPPSPSP